MDSQKATAKVIKSWYDKGYINKNAISNKVRSKDAFEQGKSAVAYGNTNDIQGTLAKAAENGWEVEIIPNLSSKGTYPQDPYINNGVSIAAGSKNPERAMMALDLIMEEPSYNNLVYFGLEGVNYVVKDGKIALPDGVTAESNTYPPDAAGFWFTNKSQHLPLASWNEQYIAHKQSLKNILVPYVYNSFAMETSKFKTELATMGTVGTQYQLPIQGGIVKDVDAAYATLEEKAKKAGLDAILAEANAQAQAYLASQK
jgi:putative aldouronate transport system substrate-binding protein